MGYDPVNAWTAEDRIRLERKLRRSWSEPWYSNEIVARTAQEEIFARIIKEKVIPAAPMYRVVSGVATKEVITETTAQEIVASFISEQVVVGLSKEGVVVAQALKRVVARRAGEGIWGVSAYQVIVASSAGNYCRHGCTGAESEHDGGCCQQQGKSPHLHSFRVGGIPHRRVLHRK